MKIETKRLIIKPLSEQEIRKYILDDNSLESLLELEHRSRIVTERIKEIIENKIIPNLIDKTKKDLYYTFWIIINKKKNTMVGDISFKGEPNENGEIEIGYGTYPAFQRNGYMTEAIGKITNWAFDHDNLNAIIAETDPNNIASHKVLKKNKFIVERQTIDNLYWRLDRK